MHDTPIIDQLPDPPVIRARLSDLAAEADLLRALLRLWESRECGRTILRRRREGGLAARQEGGRHE
jgi:hypothetical protein